MRSKRGGRIRHAVYLLLAAAMLFIALPNAAKAGTEWHASLFWWCWIAFSAVIIAANINALLLSEEKRKEMLRIKRAKAIRLERAVEKSLARLRRSDSRQ